MREPRRLGSNKEQPALMTCNNHSNDDDLTITVTHKHRMEGERGRDGAPAL